MSAFKRFGPGDQIDNVLVLEPTWVLASGTSGWRGSPEGSASVSLYGGYNRQPGGVVREYSFQRTIQGTDSFGKLSRSEPITASANFVWMTDESLNLSQRSSTRWGHEHWKTVTRLYDYYSRRDPDYTTASYDHYVLYFQKDSRNVVALSGSTPQTTGSFTLESWVKPFLTQSSTNDFTIQSRNNVAWLGVTGSTGRLAFSSSYGVVTASAGPGWGSWSHVALSYDATTFSGTFYLNLQRVGTFTMSPLTASASATLHTFGNRLDGYGGVPEGSWSTGSLRRSFHGFIGESRIWTSARTYTQISSSHNQRLTGSALTLAQSVLWLNEGPLGSVNGFVMGSGVLDQAQLATGSSLPYGNLRGFDDRIGPVWHPSDNTLFYAPKNLVTGSVTRMLGVTVPAGMYGRRIVPNTLRLTCNTYDDPSYGLIRTIVDDGRGNLYLSASLTKLPALSYPQSAGDSVGVFGVPMMAGWLCDELSGDLVPSFSPVDAAVNLVASGAPTYGSLGPKKVETDLAVGFSTDASYFDGGNNHWGLNRTSDLLLVWVAKIVTEPSTFTELISNTNGGGWAIWIGPGSMRLFLRDETLHLVVQSTSSANIIGEYHVGAAAYNRSTGKTCFAIKGVTSGITYISTTGSIEVATTASFDSGATLRVGQSYHFGIAPTGTLLAAMYINTGSNVASGITTNMLSVINPLIDVINSQATLRAGSGVEWNKVGNIFYDEGLVVIKDPALLDFAAPWTGVSDSPNDLLQLSFRGESRIPVKTLMCRIDRGDLNSSLNQTLYETETDGSRVRVHPSGNLYVSTVGIYNSDRELVGIARLAEPLRVRPRDRMNVKLRMDF